MKNEAQANFACAFLCLQNVLKVSILFKASVIVYSYLLVIVYTSA